MLLTVSLGENHRDMASGHKDRNPAFYGELEMIAFLHRPCEIVYRSDNGARTVIRDRIARIYTEEGREWLQTAAGLRIGLDRLEQVAGRRPSGTC